MTKRGGKKSGVPLKTNKKLKVTDFAERDGKLLLNAGMYSTSTEGPMVAEVHLQKKIIKQNPD